MQIDEFLNRRSAAERIRSRGLPCEHATLATLASKGRGPIFVRYGQRALYRPDDVDAWVNGRIVAAGGRAS